MAALVQSFPQQSSTITMLQTRASSDPFQPGSQSQQQLRNAQIARGIYGTSNGITSYRGHTSIPPVAPYAFTSVPVTPAGGNPLRQHPTTPHLRQENRTISAPTVNPGQQTLANGSAPQNRQRQLATMQSSVPVTISAESTTASYPFGTRDDSAIPVPRTTIQRPLSAMELSVSDPKLSALGGASKPSPDRYRRNHRRAETGQPAFASPQAGGSAVPSGSGMATVGHLYNPAVAQTHQMNRGAQIDTRPRLVSKDDMVLNRQGSSEQAKRYRRRSISGLDAGDPIGQFMDPRDQSVGTGQQKTYASVASSFYVPDKLETRPQLPIAASMERPASHHRTGSDHSSSSAISGAKPASPKRELSEIAPPNPTVIQGTPIAKHEAKLVNIPPRASSDGSKRITNPSPLSKPMTSSLGPSAVQSPPENQHKPKPTQPPPTATNAPVSKGPESPAAQQLAALSNKEGKKEGKSSRLRRAFSFGSAAELRKASAENSHNNNVSAERAKLRKDRYHDEREAEQAAIAQKQEAGGLGEGIYSGQGHFFTGSTDNLSISSTASSASIMLRKMGKGMKKSTRSLVGLFRPKSVIGVPAADAALPQASIAQVSMVTVEAEREKVNVNASPHDQAGGGTGYPRLERNSLDAGSLGTTESSQAFSDRGSEIATYRRSIVGGERERAEVLAAVKKGILKRNDSGSSSPLPKAADGKYTNFTLPQIPHITDYPSFSTPSTPRDEQPSRSGHRRTDSVTIEGEDYFMGVARFAGSEAKSMPGTPRSLAARNISFSPRIIFHDTWPSGEYDRRGEIATCNRLTPVLAQQIKEELNSFKMEMEVHEESKLNTHFF